MRVSIAVGALFSTFLLGCAPAAEPPPEIDLEAARTALMAADQAWFEEYSASDTPADVFAANMAEGAYLLPPDAPMVQGREGIHSTIANLEAMPGFEVTWRPVAAEVAASGDMGYTIGTYEINMAPGGSPITISGKYLTAWKKQQDGTWKVTADMFNANGPPSPAAE